MRCEHVVRVDAPLDRVYAVMADVTRWPEFMSALEEARVLESGDGDAVVEMRERTGCLRDVSRALVRFHARGMRVVHRGGALRTCDVSWRLDPERGATRVVVEHAFELGWPLLGTFLDRAWIGPRILGPIVERSLANFKALVESGRPARPRRGWIRTENRVDVRAPVEAVWAVAEDKAGFPAFMPHVLESAVLRDGDRVRFRMAARMRYGFVSRWISERVAAEPPRRADYRTEGFCRRMEGRWTCEAAEPEADGTPRTRLTLTHDFEVGHPVLRRLVPLDRIVTACVHDNAQRMLEAIRDRVEASVWNQEACHA